MTLGELYIDVDGNPAHNVFEKEKTVGVIYQLENGLWEYMYSIGYTTFCGDCFETREEAAEYLVSGFKKQLLETARQLS